MSDLPDLSYCCPRDLDEAIRALARPRACAYAGGTDLLVALSARERWTVGVFELVDIKHLDAAKGISARRDTLRIGALVTADELASSAIVRREAPALAEAAAATSAPALRRRGTVGGNIVTPHPAGDVVTALLALDATAEVIEDGVCRDRALADLLSLRSKRRAPSRLILAVKIRKCRQSAYEKLGSRAGFSRSIVSTCVVVCDGALRVALGGLGERPFLAENATIAAAEGRPVKAVLREKTRPPKDGKTPSSYRPEARRRVDHESARASEAIVTRLAARARISMRVNGESRDLDVAASVTLADALREQLSLTGTKVGCDVGECSACTVLIDGVPTLSCLFLAVEADGCEVTTIESVADPRVMALQRAFVREAGLQCGFCTPGIILAASRLAVDADDEAIRSALVGNICRCTGYTKIVEAVRCGLRVSSHAKKR